MKQTNEDVVSSTKGQVAAICEELVRHSTTIDQLISEEGPVHNLVIQGHMEAHLEKIENSLIDLCHKYEIAEQALMARAQSNQKPNADDLETQRQGMTLLLNNIKKIEGKVKTLLTTSSTKGKPYRISPLRDLSRKLKNDLCRTSYLLQ